MSATIILIFLWGILNFAMHRAMLESPHVLTDNIRRVLSGVAGGWGTYMFEFAILLGVMVYASLGAMIALPVYTLYTAVNAIALYVLISQR